MLHAVFTGPGDEPYDDRHWRRTIGLLHACKLSRKMVLGRWISVIDNQGEHEDYGWTWTKASEELYQLREHLSTDEERWNGSSRRWRVCGVGLMRKTIGGREIVVAPEVMADEHLDIVAGNKDGNSPWIVGWFRVEGRRKRL